MTVVGIDLGTSSCSVSMMVDGRPQVLPVFSGRDEMPTYVAFTGEGERLIGLPAKRQSINNPKNTIFTVKRLIGRKFASEETKAELGLLPFKVVASPSRKLWIEAAGRVFSPIEITAMMLAEVRKAAEAYLGETIDKAVVTVPAYFDNDQRAATRQAAKMAGIDTLRLIAEPTAASLAYGFGNAGRRGTIAVYDLGGGTFDISVLEIGDGVFEVKSVNGDNRLGGEDFDHLLVRHFVADIRKNHGVDLSEDPLALHRMKDAAESLKIELDQVERASSELPYLAVSGGRPFHARLELTRARLQELFGGLIERTLGPCQTALRDAGVEASRLDGLILVGGMSRMPGLRSRVADFFGVKPSTHQDPSRIVALGAAISAGVLKGNVKDVLLLDVGPMSLGFLDAENKVVEVIERNTTYPTKKTLRFKVGRRETLRATRANSESAERELGEIDSLALIEKGWLDIVEAKTSSGEDAVALNRIPLEDMGPRPGGTAELEVTFDVDANTSVSVTVANGALKRECRIAATRDWADPGAERPVAMEASAIRARADGLLNVIQASVAAHRGEYSPAALHRLEASRTMLERAMQGRDETELRDALKIFCDANGLSLPSKPGDYGSPQEPVALKATAGGPSIFISYARQDIAWLDRLRTHLAPLERAGKVEIWHDGKIAVGGDWKAEIEAALAKASLAILVISAHFMASQFIYENELPPIIARGRANGLTIFPLIVGHCLFMRDPALSHLGAFNDPSKPLGALSDPDAEAELVRLASMLWNRIA